MEIKILIPGNCGGHGDTSEADNTSLTAGERFSAVLGQDPHSHSHGDDIIGLRGVEDTMVTGNKRFHCFPLVVHGKEWRVSVEG